MKKSEELKLHKQSSDEHQLMIRQERERLKSQELVKAKIDTAEDERYRKSQIINKLILVDSLHKCKLAFCVRNWVQRKNLTLKSITSDLMLRGKTI